MSSGISVKKSADSARPASAKSSSTCGSNSLACSRAVSTARNRSCPDRSNAAEHWPLVERASRSPQSLVEYLIGFDNGELVTTSIAPPEVEGRFFYGPRVQGFNFTRQKATLSAIAAKLLDQTLKEESQTDELLTGIADKTVNREAMAA